MTPETAALAERLNIALSIGRSCGSFGNNLPSNIYVIAEEAATLIESQAGRIERGREVLTVILNHYLSLANCGDCGFWDPEAEAEVIACRALLDQGEG